MCCLFVGCSCCCVLLIDCGLMCVVWCVLFGVVFAGV